MCQEQDHRAQQLNRELQQVQGKCASLEQQLNESMSKQTFLQEQRDELLKSLNLEQQKGKEDKSDLEEHAEKLEEKVEELKRKNRLDLVFDCPWFLCIPARICPPFVDCATWKWAVLRWGGEGF